MLRQQPAITSDPKRFAETFSDPATGVGWPVQTGGRQINIMGRHGNGCVAAKGAVKSQVTKSSSHPITPDLLGRSRRSLHHSMQRIGFHQPFWSSWPWVTFVTSIGQWVTFSISKREKANIVCDHRKWSSFDETFLNDCHACRSTDKVCCHEYHQVEFSQYNLGHPKIQQSLRHLAF